VKFRAKANSPFDKLRMRGDAGGTLYQSLILSLSAFAKAAADQENKTRPP
jgi:hypothetical protein